MAKNLSIAPLVALYAPVLTEKQREVIEQYYFEDLSLAEIAEGCGISRQGVRDAIKRGEAIILELEEQLGFAAKEQRLESALEQMRSAAKEIELLNDTIAGCDPIGRAAESIVRLIDGLDD